LVGDVARCAFPFFEDVAVQFLELMASKFLDLTKTTEVPHLNNALWASGEIAIRCGARLKPVASPLLTLLVRILVNESEDLPPAVKQNAGIAVGRVALVCADMVAPHLEQFAERWMDVMRMAPNNTEKVEAFSGMVKAIQLNPRGIFDHFAYLCDAISSWDPKLLPPELACQFREILFFFRNEVGAEQWQQFLHDPQFDPIVRECLQKLYGL
jgi:transportin-1